MNKNDLRYKKTEKLIVDSFLSCVDEFGFENTFVSTICDKAMINRKTFYLHYLDKYDLLDRIYMDLKDELMNSLSKEAVINLGKSDLYESVRWCITQANAHRELIRILLKSSRIEFRDILIGIFSRYPARQLILNYDEIATNVEYEIICVYMCDAMIGFFEIWFNHYDQFSLEKAIDLMYALVNEPAQIYMDKLMRDQRAILIVQE